MDDMDGHHIIMNNVSAGGLFGEAYCFLGTDAPHLHLRGHRGRGALDAPYPGQGAPPPLQERDQMLANRFVAALASRTLSLNQRIQILSRRTLREKLITFLSQYATAQGDTFTVPFDRASMANFLGADRSALSRELSHLRKEGVLDYHRNQFRILK